MYASELGFICGVSAYCKRRKERRAGALMKVRVPRARAALRLRSGTDMKVFEQVYVDRQYDLKTVEPPRLIIDAGAHVGCASVFFALRFPDCTIVAIEPEPVNFALLCQNVAPYPNVIPIRGALWHRQEAVTVADPDADSWSFQVAPASSDARGTIVGLTIDEILAWCSASKIDILKLDIEGAEKEIFATGHSARWLNDVRMMVVELHDRIVPGCTAALEDATRDQTFSRWRSGECLVMGRV
jgi:FkbM family methyltransferase